MSQNNDKLGFPRVLLLSDQQSKTQRLTLNDINQQQAYPHIYEAGARTSWTETINQLSVDEQIE